MILSKNLVRYNNVHCCAVYDNRKLKTIRYSIARDWSNELRYTHSVEYFEAIKSDV